LSDIPPPGPRPIRRLLRSTVERIAAGEVVERPASVVKELVENAVDAGASSVSVRLVGGGTERIEVADDGSGIAPDELELAVERHATSKLSPEGPVERIDSLGFRGEALAAIGAVSRLRLLSRTPDRAAAEGISVVGGTIAGRFVAPRARGTTVEVEDLFFNTPARRKFEKSPASEQVEVVRTVERLYLARPAVGFRVESEGHEIAVYPSTTSLRDAAARVVGAGFLEHSFPVRGEIPGGHLYGVCALPAVAGSSSTSLYFAVNGRSIASRPLAQAVRVAYRDMLPRTRYPVGVLHLELEADRLDVNVHPTKREVRFAHERELSDAVLRHVREALLAAPTVSNVLGAGRPMTSAASDLAGERFAPGPSIEPGTPGPSIAQRTLEPVDGSPVKAPLEGAAGRPRFELLGPLHALYWIAATDEGLVVVDQHAASERLVFESLRRDRALGRQILVDPVSLPLSGAQQAALAAHAEAIRAAGFEVEPFGPSTFRVRSVPSFRGHRARAEGVRELLDELAAGARPTLPDDLADRTAATIACHSAIRAGDVVAREEIADVLRALDSLPGRPRTCPHGRPIFVRIARTQLDRWFLRTGP